MVGTDRGGAARGAWLALCVGACAWGGCREERPTGGAGPAEAGTTTAENGKADEPAFPDEPAVEVRKFHQASGEVVVTVHPHGVTWVDGELSVMFDLTLRLRREREAGRTKVRLLVTEGTPLDAWAQMIPMLEQAGFGEADRTIVFDVPGLGRPESPAPPAPPPPGAPPDPPGAKAGSGR